MLHCLAVALVVADTAVHPAAPRGLYTPAKLVIMQDNLDRYDWARQERDRIVAAADKWLALGDDGLRVLIAPPSVPRAYTVHASGCPVHGEEVNKISRYGWIIKPDQPYRIVCPVGGESYPSNDYPDDGWGWTTPGVDHKFWFVAYWAHWSARNFVHPALRDLSRAYLLTDDPRYAHACAVLLWQLAVYYPDYNYETQSRYGTEFDHHYYGRLLYHTWETWTVQESAPAYDAVRPAIDADAELQGVSGLTGPELRALIESRLLRTMARDIMGEPPRIQGNYGMHQVGLLRVAAALGDGGESPTRREMIDWVLGNDQGGLYTSIGLDDALANLVHRDGVPFESPSYNLAWNTELTMVAEALQDAGVDVFQVPRSRKLLTWPLPMICAGEFTPPLGDSNNLFSLALGLGYPYAGLAVRHYDDPASARAVVQAGDAPPRDLFVEPIEDKVATLAAQHPERVGIHSSLLPGLGFATLQCGGEANRTAAAIFYGHYVGHKHFDTLQLDLYSHRNALIPDFGYPETADSFDPRRFGFFNHTVSHNTVLVDAKRQTDGRGRLHFYDPGDFAQAVEVSAEPVYPGVGLYRRTLILVEVTPQQAFLVDIFRVRGGTQHDLMVHGTQAAFESSLPLTPPQAEGSLAGPDVPYGRFYDDPKLRDAPAGTVPYYGYTGSGFQYLFNVQQSALNGVATADWRLNRPAGEYPNRPTDGVVYREHLVGRDETVLVCDGRPQARRGWPETVKFVDRRRAGDGLESAFVTVHEPFQGQPFIESVRALPCTGAGLPVALEVLAGGRPHLVFSRLEDGVGPITISLDGQDRQVDARVAVLAPDRSYLLDSEPAQTAKVTAVDLATGSITLDAGILADGPPAGGHLIVDRGERGAAVPVAATVGARTCAVGDDDLCAATVTVKAVEGEQLTAYPPQLYYAEPGMSLVNEAGAVVGRFAARTSTGLTVSDAPHALTLDDFPDVDGDGRRRLRVAVVGPGDTVVAHRSLR